MRAVDCWGKRSEIRAKSSAEVPYCDCIEGLGERRIASCG
jgi:hypothetical protein